MVGAGSDAGAALCTIRDAPAARVRVTEFATVSDDIPGCGKDSGIESGDPVSVAKNFSVACAEVVPVLTSTNVVCQPLPVAICAMLPPLVPMLANAGMVVSVSVFCKGVVRIPNTLILPLLGVMNSIVPRLLRVIGYWSESTKDVWPLAASANVVPGALIVAPVSSRMTMEIVAKLLETYG